MKYKRMALWSLLLALASAQLNAAPLGTAFTYQGRLSDGPNPANSRYDLQCAVYDAATLGNRIGNVVINTAVKIVSGQVDESLNGLADTVTLEAGANMTITPSGNPLPLAGASGWALGGNAGTTAANFLGTIDGQPLLLKANNDRILRLEPN